MKELFETTTKAFDTSGVYMKMMRFLVILPNEIFGLEFCGSAWQPLEETGRGSFLPLVTGCASRARSFLVAFRSVSAWRPGRRAMTSQAASLLRQGALGCFLPGPFAAGSGASQTRRARG